jgi:methylthioribose-1-phosphate isomerase
MEATNVSSENADLKQASLDGMRDGMPEGVQTMRWLRDAQHAGVLSLIDQRILPHRIEQVWCHNAQQVAAAIRDMVVRGAPAIGCAAAFGMAAEAIQQQMQPAAAFDAALDAAHAVLAASRPTAVNLFWALDRMQRLRQQLQARNAPVAERARALEQEACDIMAEDIAINRAMGEAGAALVPDGARIMTHCNAGALATAGHGTALGVMRSARDAGKRISVLANETRPFLQGARLTAWELVQERIPVTLVTDNMCGHLMQQGRVDLVIVGADRIAANGDAANKIGTYGVAVLAARHGIPFYVAAPLSTFDLSLADGSAIPIEERSHEEVLGWGGLRWAPEGVSVLNPAFDVTPAELIAGLITERGVVLRPRRESIAALFQKNK